MKERNKTKPRGSGDQGPRPRGPHHLRAPGASTQTASPRVGPKRGPWAPIPLPRPGSLTCEHREQNQLGKQEPWTAGQPSRVHPSRWPEVARQASRTDRRTGAAGSDGRARNGKGMEGMEGTEGGQMEPAVLPGGGSRRDLAMAREPGRGARGSLCLSRWGPGGGRGGRSCVLGHPGSRFIAAAGGTDAGWGRRWPDSSPRPSSSFCGDPGSRPSPEGRSSTPGLWLLLWSLASSFSP